MFAFYRQGGQVGLGSRWIVVKDWGEDEWVAGTGPTVADAYAAREPLSYTGESSEEAARTLPEVGWAGGALTEVLPEDLSDQDLGAPSADDMATLGEAGVSWLRTHPDVPPEFDADSWLRAVRRSGLGAGDKARAERDAVMLGHMLGMALQAFFEDRPLDVLLALEDAHHVEHRWDTDWTRLYAEGLLRAPGHVHAAWG